MNNIIDQTLMKIGEQIEVEGKKRQELIRKVINQLVNSSGDPFEIMEMLDDFDKDELIAIIFALTRRLKDMMKEKERLDNDRK